MRDHDQLTQVRLRSPRIPWGSPLIAERFRELAHCPFARRIRCHIYTALKCSQTGCIDDVPLDLVLDPIFSHITT